MKTDYITPQQWEKLLPLMQPANALALRVSLETGLRIGDVLELKRENVNFHAKTVHFIAKKTKKAGKAAISTDVAKMLKKCGQGYLFPSSRAKAKHITRQAVYADMKKAAARCGIEQNAAPHSARKTFAVQEYRRKPLEAVQAELQHDNPLVTLLYATSDRGQQNKAENGNFYAFLHDIALAIAEVCERYRT